jgi:putative oxidoreductase
MKNRILNYQSLNTDLAALFLRIILGGLMMYHGYPKLTGFGEMINTFPDLIGIGGKLSLVLLVFAEFFCGLFLILGLFTRLSTLPILIAMIVAFFVAHSEDPFQTKELAFVFLLLSIVVFILGSGRYSLDSLLLNRKTSHH